MSGYTENAIGHNGMLDQGITLLQKPFTLPSLKEKVRAVLDSAPLPQEVAMSSRAIPQAPAAGNTRETLAFRAQRFNLHLPLRYRPVGEQSWLKGPPKTSAAPACSFMPKKTFNPICNWKSTWSCPLRSPDSPPPKSCVAEKSFARWRPRLQGHPGPGSQDSAIPLSARIARVPGLIHTPATNSRRRG